MPTWTPPVTLVAKTNENVNDLNTILASLQTLVNGLDDQNIAAAAGIQESKLASGVTGLAKGTFSAYLNVAQSIPNTTNTTVLFDTELYDVSGWFDVATNKGRFTPLVAGYYRFSWLVMASATPVANTAWQSRLRKNGADLVLAQPSFQVGTAVSVASGGSTNAVANGSTDFFEVGIFHNEGVARTTATGASNVYFTGELIARS